MDYEETQLQVGGFISKMQQLERTVKEAESEHFFLTGPKVKAVLGP